MGLVHLLLSTLVITVALGGSSEQTSQSGAFTALAEAPFGIILVWVIAALLAVLGAHQLADGLVVRGSDEPDRWRRRIASWGRGVVYLILAVLAAAIALGARPNSEQSAEDASEGVLSLFAGPIVLGILGIGILIAGVAYAGVGVTRGFQKKMSYPGGGLGMTVTVLGIVGYVAKGLALAVVGILVVIAAVTTDPDAAGGLDEAIHSLLALPAGPALVIGVGTGFAAYGLFCFFRARYADL
tara:strand:- start:564 stop:1286 length:723 start_codon:yes stop_codon:yes gene_type:complete